MEVPLVLITRTNLTSSRVRIEAEYADSLRDFLYKKKLAVSPVESRPQPVFRVVKGDNGATDVKVEEYPAAFHITATPDVLNDLLIEWAKSLSVGSPKTA